MEITISKPFRNPNNHFNENSYNLVCRVYGLPSQAFQDNGGANIDFSIIDIIVFLNKAGYSTYCCCSGNDCDHSHPEDNGYIWFKDLISDEQWNIIRKIGVQCGFKVYKDVKKAIYISGDDEKKRKAWTKFKHLIELNL
jgi:hypothetical protein